MASEKSRHLRETFEIKSGGDNESEIKRVFGELKNTAITPQNFMKHYERVRNTLTIIHAQLENDYSQYVEFESEYKKLGESERTKKAIESKIIPLEVFQARINMSKRERQIISWTLLAYDICETTMKKLAAALNEMQAYEIKRDVLKEMREMENARNKLFEEVISSRFESMDNKFLAGLKALQEENRIDRKENSNTLSSAIVTASQLNRDAIKVLFEMISRSYPDKYDDIDEIRKKFDNVHSEFETQSLSELKGKKEHPDIRDRVNKEAEEVSPKKKQKVEKSSIKEFEEGLEDFTPPVAIDDDKDDEESSDEEDVEGEPFEFK